MMGLCTKAQGAVLALCILALTHSSVAFQPSTLSAPGLGLRSHGAVCGARRLPCVVRAPRAARVETKAQMELAAAAPAVQGLISTATSLSGLAVLGGVIAFHEAGHFLAARAQGIIVQDFSIGFGPKILQYKDKEGINYSLRLLPLGGYVSFPEAIPEEEEEEGREGTAKSKEEPQLDESGEPEKVYAIDDPNLLQNRPVGQRAIVISAGVIFNMILSFFAILVTVSNGGVLEPELLPGVQVPALVDTNGAGARYGIKGGDIILKVDGKVFPAEEKSTQNLVNEIKRSGGKTLHFEIQRQGKPVELDVTPDKTRSGDGVMGVKLAANVKKVTAKKPANPVEAVSLSVREFGRIFSQTLGGLVKLFGNLGTYAGSVSGPVGVMQMGAEAGQQGALLTFAALISINLGIMNALPLPALDGGQLMFLAVEAVQGKPLDQRVVRGINGTALSVLIVLSLALLIGDLEKLIPLSLR
mmetsp:Transcript_12390/g.30365  ORF Transcript_12390/g.30365 Transcript_12390/m.30365 type:complete len:471 (-) Transcript_12390:64-1476(-)